MLQAFIDESCEGTGDDRLFVMAGYISSVERWMKFSDEWSALWASRPPLFQASEFKQRNMSSSRQGLEFSESLFRIVEQHAELYVVSVVRLADIERAYAAIQWPDWLVNTEILKNEFFNAFDQIVRGLPRFQGQIGVNEPIDVYFDDHSSKTKCLQFWEILKNYGLPCDVLSDTPNFLDSKKIMPLQAADQLAYWARENFSPPAPASVIFPWKRSKDVKGIYIYSTPAHIAANMQNALNHMVGIYQRSLTLVDVLTRGGARSWQARFVSSLGLPSAVGNLPGRNLKA